MENSIVNFFNQADIFGIFLKPFGIVLGFLYLFFSIVVLRQVRSMRKTVTFHDRGFLELGSYAQIILATVILVYALFIL